MNKYETIAALAHAGKHAHTQSSIEGAVRKVLDGDSLTLEDAVRLRQEYKDDWAIWDRLSDVFFDVIDNVELGIAPIYHTVTDPSGMTVPVLDDPVYPGSERELGIFESAAKALCGAFHWSDDIKGHDYWSELDKNLQDRVDNGDGPRLEPFDFGAGLGPMAQVAHVKDVVFNKIRWEDDIDGEAYWADVYENLCRVYTSFDGDRFDPEPVSSSPTSERPHPVRNIDMLAKVCGVVMNDISWYKAPEGPSYWSSVYAKLQRLSEGGDGSRYTGKDASYLINFGMTWAETEEGHEYWMEVRNKLADLGL